MNKKIFLTISLAILIIFILIITSNKLKNNILIISNKHTNYIFAKVLQKSSIYNDLDYNKKVIDEVNKGTTIKVLKTEYEDNKGIKYYEIISKNKEKGYIKSSNIVVSDIDLNTEKQIIKGESLIENNIRHITGQ